MQENTIKFIRQKDYKFIKNIGRGATGATILIEDELINQNFVCKKYQPIMGIEPLEYYQNFVNEIKMLFLLNNRNIVRIFNYYLYPEKCTGYILMEYIEGQTIGEYLDWSPEKIDDAFYQSVQGFVSLEEAGILHRDIRDSNILVSNDGIVKIIDFGFGKRVATEDDFVKSISLNWWCETPDEFKSRIYNFKSEVYFVGKLFEKIIEDNKIESFKYFEELRGMTQKNPDKRISSFRDVYQKMVIKPEMEDYFDYDEIKIYRSFAEQLSRSIAKIEDSGRYYGDIDIITKKLDDIYRRNMLEESIQNGKELARIFINGAYYYSRVGIDVYVLKDFIKLLRGSSIEKKNIILMNISNRLDSIPRYSEQKNDPTDDIPF